MSTKRMRENLQYLLDIEADMTSRGKRLSKGFYAVKNDLQQALGYEVAC